MLLAGCASADAPNEPSRPPADVTLNGVRLTHWQGGRASAHSRLGVLEYNREASRAIATGVVVEPLNAQGEVEGTMTARTGDGKLDDGLVDLAGGVRWVSGTDVATTDSCAIDLRAQITRGSERIELTGAGYRAQGAGFTAEMSGARRVTLLGDVRAHFDDETGVASP